jgi:hypothetical protein
MGSVLIEFQERRLMSLEAEFDRLLAEHRDEGLLLERIQSWVSPCESGCVCHVRQTHRAARMELAGGPPARTQPSVKGVSCR